MLCSILVVSRTISVEIVVAFANNLTPSSPSRPGLWRVLALGAFGGQVKIPINTGLPELLHAVLHVAGRRRFARAGVAEQGLRIDVVHRCLAVCPRLEAGLFHSFAVDAHPLWRKREAVGGTALRCFEDSTSTAEKDLSFLALA